MANEPKIECPTCHGTGEAKLSPALEEVYRIVRRCRIASPEKVLAKIPDRVTVSAISNRMKDLWAMGLLDRSKRGRTYFYSICQKKTQN